MERRAETRRALLDAAAELFATRGIDGASVDAIAEAAGRTSGAVYDHFGGKEGLLFCLLEGWVDDVTEAVAAQVAAAEGLDEQMAALWRNVTRPVTGDGRWIALEHELWRYASRRDEARSRHSGFQGPYIIVATYRVARNHFDKVRTGVPRSDDLRQC